MGGASATPAIELQGVNRWYGDGRVKALDNVSLALARGECLAVVGPSGSGKSTLLHLLCGLDRPTSGRVLFEGREPASVGEWARLRAARIGFVFQAAHLLPTLTAAENVEVPMFGLGRGRRERERRARELLDRVGLAGRAAHRPAELSGGERQRVALARSLANGPDVLLADEPTGNLDSVSAAAMLELLLGLRAQHGMTLVIVTHNPEVAARAARVVHLFDGRIATDSGGGPP